MRTPTRGWPMNARRCVHSPGAGLLAVIGNGDGARGYRPARRNHRRGGRQLSPYIFRNAPTSWKAIWSTCGACGRSRPRSRSRLEATDWARAQHLIADG